METRGRVNQYVEKTSGASVFSINLSDGVTPFILFHDGREYYSNFYRINSNRVFITYVYYRPKADEFNKLEESVKQHILMGGLISKKLKDNPDPIHNLPNGDKTSFDEFKVWCEDNYGTSNKEDLHASIRDIKNQSK